MISTNRFSIAMSVFALFAGATMYGCQRGQVAPDSIPSPLEGPRLSSAQKTYQVIYQTQPDPIPLNEPFGIKVRVLNANDQSPVADQVKLAVDGRMPHHRHGMNRHPTITSNGQGVYTIENMLFHMPGRWELYFDISDDGHTERAQDVIFLD